MALKPGQVLNQRYRIAKLLGQGGFGAVYRAWDLQMEGLCAVKENFDTSPAAQKQFEREAKLLYKLRHPNLPRVFDHFNLPGQGQYLVMDYIEGQDLQTTLEKAGGPLPEAQVVAWVTQVCEALSYLHSQKPAIIHRDIKPANIRITPSSPGEGKADGQAVLVDFGIAKAHDPRGKTTTGARAVTPGYSPPEQFGLGTTDEKSDVYALGATAYHLLTGDTPPAAMEVMAGTAGPPRPACEVNPAVSPGVSAAVAHAMQFSRAGRTDSAAQFKAELLSPGFPHVGQTSETVQVIPSTATQMQFAQAQFTPAQGASVQFAPTQAAAADQAIQPAARKPRRTWRWIGVALAAFLVMGWFLAQGELTTRLQATGLSLAGVFGALQPTSTSTPTREIATARPTLTEAIPSPTSTVTSTAIPTLSLPVEIGTPLPASSSTISVDNADQITTLGRLRLGGTLTKNYLRWSSNGRFLAIALGQRIYLFDPKTLKKTKTIETESPVVSLDIAGNGYLVAAGFQNGNAAIWIESEKDPLHKIGGHDEEIGGLVFSPDEEILATGSPNGVFKLWQVTGGRVYHTFSGSAGIASLDYSPDGQTVAVGGNNGDVSLWQVSDFRLLKVLKGHTDPLVSVAYSPDGSLIASGAKDGEARLWQVSDGALLQTWRGNGQVVNCLAFSPDGSLLAIGSQDDTLRLWRISDGSLLKEARVSTTEVTSIAFSPDGLYLAVATWGNTIYILGVMP